MMKNKQAVMPISLCPNARAYRAITITTATTKKWRSKPLVLVLLSNFFNLKALMYPDTMSKNTNQSKIWM